MRLTIQAKDLDRLAARLAKNANQAKKALTATGSDMKKRVPGWAGTAVTEVYNIKKQEVTPTKTGKPKKTAGTIRVEGATVSSVEITYTGRPLTPTHFGMTPRTLTKRANTNTNTKRKKKKARKKTQITAVIKKGQKKSLGSNVFLGSNRGGGYIPFKRSGRKAYPIESVKTVSLPQMIDNPNVRETLTEKINKGLEERLEHNIRRYLK